MEGYFQLSAQERMNLTEQKIQDTYLPYHLMENGLFRPEEPTYLSVPEESSIEPEGTAMYELVTGGYSSTDLVFQDESVFDAFVTLKPQKISGERIGSKDYHYTIQEQNISAKMIVVYKEEEIKAYKRANADRNNALSHNKALRSNYQTELSNLRKSTKQIWDDWHSLQDKKRLLSHILKTYTGYVELAGDEKIALGFLHKVPEFGKWDIYYAFKFAGENMGMFDLESNTIPPRFEA